MQSSSHVSPTPTPVSNKLSPKLATILAAAAEAVAGVIDGRTPEASLQACLPAVRAGAMDLTYTTLRDYGRGDFLLAQLTEKRLPDTLVHSLLLVALSRLERRPEDAHTLVNQATDAAKEIGNGRYKGVVNGVLRNFLRRQDELSTAADADAVALHRHPAWWISRIRADHPQHWQAILAAGNSHPPMCLRAQRRRVTSTNWQDSLTGEGIDARALNDEAYLLTRPIPVERIPGFADGLCSVQDFGAQAAAHLLDLSDGMSVLDACAAPGGKAAHLLELANVRLTALDIDERRLQRVQSNLDRLGLSATLKVGDAAKLDTWWDGQSFERILADVPCSASGVVRRHPDAKWLRRETDLRSFARQQASIIDALWQTLARGGKMLYCTCSLFDQENAAQIGSFMARHTDAQRLPTHLNTPSQSDLELKLLPTAEHDGFYYALLQKR